MQSLRRMPFRYSSSSGKSNYDLTQNREGEYITALFKSCNKSGSLKPVGSHQDILNH